jgi:hypothetical protein
VLAQEHGADKIGHSITAPRRSAMRAYRSAEKHAEEGHCRVVGCRRLAKLSLLARFSRSSCFVN